MDFSMESSFSFFQNKSLIQGIFLIAQNVKPSSFWSVEFFRPRCALIKREAFNDSEN